MSPDSSMCKTGAVGSTQNSRACSNSEGTSRRVQKGPCSEPRGYRRQGPAPPGPLTPSWTRCPTPCLFPPSARRLNPEQPTDRRRETEVNRYVNR